VKGDDDVLAVVVIGFIAGFILWPLFKFWYGKDKNK